MISKDDLLFFGKVLLNAIIVILLFTLLFACRPKERIVEKVEYITLTDSTYKTQYDSLIKETSKVEQRYIKELKEKEISVANEIAAVIGNIKDSLCNIPVQDLSLSSGRDSLFLSGKWLYLSYRWKIAERTSTNTSRLDSFSSVIASKDKTISSLKQDYFELQQSYVSLKEKEIKRSGIRLNHFLYIFIGGLVLGGFLVFRFIK